VSLEELRIFFERVEFHSPWLALLAPLGLAVVWIAHRPGRRVPAIAFPTMVRLAGLRRTWRQRIAALSPFLHGSAVVLLALAAARPRLGDTRTEVTKEGIAIQMVLDRSSSMKELMPFEGRERRRIDIVREVFQDFVAGDGEELPGRRGDLVGLTTFARYTEVNCPLVAEHEPLLAAVGQLRTVPEAIDLYGRPIHAEDLPKRFDESKYRGNPLNATAIGDGIHRAVLSLVAAEADLGRSFDESAPSDAYKIRSKLIIVLTDSEDNASEMSPIDAGKLAAENDIRIYYVVFSGRNVYQHNPFTGRRELVSQRSRDDLLALPRQVAGSPERAFLAEDGDALKEIYREIDRLEKTHVGKVEYRSYAEKFHVFLVPGLIALIVAFILREGWARSLP
jgi:Ca-activated chloride channel family protein